MTYGSDTNLENWRKKKSIGITMIISSVAALLIAFLLYGRTINNIIITAESSKVLTDMAIALYILLLATLIAVTLGIYHVYKYERSRIESRNDRTSIRAIMLRVFDAKRYRNIFTLSAIGYGIFYAFITNLLVYRPNEVFSQVYRVSVPSWHLVPCCGTPGYLPILVAYITEQFGLLVIPLNLVLLIIVSVLVGINISLAVFAYDNRPRNENARWFTGFGATTALFTGCPTCAGTFFATIFGLGVGTSALALAPLQSLFIAISIPILLIAPILMARNVRKSIYGCSTRTSD